MIEITPATINDIEVIQNIARPTWGIAYQEILSDEQMQYMIDMMYSTESLKNQMENEGHVFLLACENETPIGFVSFQLGEEKVKLHKLYVLPQQQGKKIGEKLIKEVERKTSEAGRKSVLLNVNRYNKALHFYKREGFNIIEEVDIEIGNGYLMEDYVLEKRV